MLLHGVSADVIELGVRLLTGFLLPQNPSLVQSWRKDGQRRNIIIELLRLPLLPGSHNRAVFVTGEKGGSDAKVSRQCMALFLS